MKKKVLTLVATSLLLAGSFSCSDNELSSEKNILSFTHDNLVEIKIHDEKIKINEHTVTTMSMTWAEGTDLTSVYPFPVITVSPGATILRESGTAQDFSGQVNYIVTAEDGTSNYYLALSNTASLSTKKVNIYILPTIGGTTLPPANIEYSVDSMSIFQVSAYPNPGFGFERWFINGEPVETTSTTLELKVIDNVNINPSFYPNSQYIVIVLSGNTDRGIVSGGGDFIYGGSVEISAIPNEGFTFEGWYRDGVKISAIANTTYQPVPSESCTLIAKFDIEL